MHARDYLIMEYRGGKLVAVPEEEYPAPGEPLIPMSNTQRRAFRRRYHDFKRQFGMTDREATWHATYATAKATLRGQSGP